MVLLVGCSSDSAITPDSGGADSSTGNNTADAADSASRVDSTTPTTDVVVAPDANGRDAARTDSATTADASISDAAVLVDAAIAVDAVPDVVSLLAQGSACTAGNQCASGACVDGFCCDGRCNGACEACSREKTSAANGTCAPVSSATDPDNECTDGPCATGNCNGSRACTPRAAETTCRASNGPCDIAEECSGGSFDCPADAFAPTSSLACAPYRCTGVAAVCTASCETHNDCAARAVCVGGTCVTGKRFFVTSTTHQGNFGGLDAADAICQARASGRFAGTFKAWLSTSTVSAESRLTHATVPYYRIDVTSRRIIANDWTDLTNGVSVAIASDELGNPHPDNFVWTGTSDSGAILGTNCSNWTSTAGTGMSGNSSAAAFSTYFGANECTRSHNLYCVEQ